MLGVVEGEVDKDKQGPLPWSRWYPQTLHMDLAYGSLTYKSSTCNIRDWAFYDAESSVKDPHNTSPLPQGRSTCTDKLSAEVCVCDNFFVSIVLCAKYWEFMISSCI